MIRKPSIITIQKGKITPASLRYRSIASHTLTTVLLIYNSQAGIGLLLQHLQRTVRRTIIYNNYLKILHCLTVHTP